MTDQQISPIVARLTDIVADLNRALEVARGQGVKHVVSVLKTLGSDQPHYLIRLIDPAEIAAETAAPAEDDTPLATARPAGDTEVEPAEPVVLDFAGWFRELDDLLVKSPDLANAIGDAAYISHAFPEVWRPHFEAGRSPADAIVAHLLTLAPVKAPSSSDQFAELRKSDPAAPEGETP